MNVDDGRVAAGLAPKVVQNATLVTVPGIVKHVLLSPNERIRQAKIPGLCFSYAVFDLDVKPIVLIISGVLSASLGATSGFAQQGNVPASESMHRAGESAENAATSAGHAVEHTYHGAATALKDTAITAKVKTALHENKNTKDSDIHVTAIAGVVNLKSSVPSSEVSEHATEQTTGVKGVKNQLAVAPTATH
jgi:hypothetical protein